MAKPFIKWAGGKTQLLPNILPLLKDVKVYHEPFLGGGAVFFGLRAQGFDGPAYLSDSNYELITTYREVRDNVDDVIEALQYHDRWNSEVHYYNMRERDPSCLSSIGVAARFIYLNHAGFNGLYRVNKAGKFNVPFGKKDKVKSFDPKNLREASRALRNTMLVCAYFNPQWSVIEPAASTLYIDPPYLPVRPTSFTSYQPGGFSEKDHRVLADECRALTSFGVRFILSNSDTPLTRELYKDFTIEQVMARRNVNSKGTGRGKVPELLVRNF
jgi:DNA adenine methylase